jgi:hypothetical protein
MDPDSDPGGPKASESDGSGFATLLILKYFYVVIFFVQAGLLNSLHSLQILNLQHNAITEIEPRSLDSLR